MILMGGRVELPTHRPAACKLLAWLDGIDGGIVPEKCLSLGGGGQETLFMGTKISSNE